MKLRSRNSEPLDAREAFHKNERQHVRQEKINKWFSRLFVLLAIAIIIFVFYAYIIDKPEMSSQSFTFRP